MSLRIGVDLDGTLADLSSIFHECETTLFGTTANADTHVESDRRDETLPDKETPTDKEKLTGKEKLTDKEKLKAARAETQQHAAVWRALKDTPDFWTRLKPLEPGAVAALYAAASQRQWEVFFITQRPRSAGASVQKQTQDWLIANGYPTPSVLTLIGGRGKAAHALDLDFLIDDLPKNCVDVIADSKCRPILVLREPDAKAAAAAKRMGIGVVTSVAAAIELLSQPVPEPRDTAVGRILKALGLAPASRQN